MRRKKASISHLLNDRQSKELRCILKTKLKNAQQKKNVTDAIRDVIHSKLPIFLNTKMNSILNEETDMQMKTRLGHSQLMQEKLPNEQKVCCSINVGGLSSNGKGQGGECEPLLASKNSQGFIFNAYQKENHELVKTDEELIQPGNINVQVKLQIHLPQTILDSASCPIFDQFQFGKPEKYAEFSPPKSQEAKTDAIFSAKECVVPSDASHQREQTAGIEREKAVTFDSCRSAFSTSKRKRNFKQYADMKTLVRPKCGILKAKKPSISYILNIKGGASPKHRKELGCYWTTKMEEVDQGKEMADKMPSFMTITPDMNMHSKIERGTKRLRSKQVKQGLSLHEENVTSDDTKEASLQEEEESEQETLPKGVLEQGKYFTFCSGQKEELDHHKSENERSGRILFVTEQDVPQQWQPMDPVQVEEPKKIHQTQNGTIYTAKSKLSLAISRESLRGQVFIGTMEGGIPSNGNHPGELYSHGKEERPEFNKHQQAKVLQPLAVSTPDPPESKRQRKTFMCTPLKCKVNSKCVIMKTRKTPISQIFNIPGNSCQKKLSSKTLKSRIFDFLVDIIYSDLTAERKEGLAQELPATMPESLDLSTLAVPTSKRRYLKCSGKRNKMSSKCVTLKAKNALISQTFNITKRGAPRHRRQFQCNFKVMMGKCIPVADIILNAFFSAMPISFDMNVNNRIKVEVDEPWKMRFSHELQQQEQSPDGEQACCASSSNKRDSASNSMKKAKIPGGEAAPWNTPHFRFNAPEMTEPLFVYPDVEQMNSARKKVPEFFITAQDLQQQTLFTQRVLHPIPHSILNVLPFEKLPKRRQTQTTQTGLKDTRSPWILSPKPGTSIGESFMDTAQSGIPFGKNPRKELANSIPDREMRLQEDLSARNLECSYFSEPASSDFKRQRNATQIPKSRTGKAQMVSKTMNITRSDALSHRKQQDPILENTPQQISQGKSYMFINTSFSSTPVSPAIKNHKEQKSKKGPLRKKSSITTGWEQGEGKQDKVKRLSTNSCNKWNTFKNILESTQENEKKKQDNEILSKSSLLLLSSVEHRKDQNMLIAEQEAQQQTLHSENTSETGCSPQMIRFQTEKLQKNVPPQKDTLHRIGEKILCPKSEKARFDYVLIDGTEYSTASGGSPTRKLDVHRSGFLHSKEEKEDIEIQKVVKHTVDQNLPPIKSRNSVLGDPCDESSRRKVGSDIAKKYEDLQRDLLTRSTTSVLSESKWQKEVFKFPEGKNVSGPISVTTKAQKPPCSQTLTVTEHGTLYRRKEQECNSKSTIKDMQQNKSIDNALSSPTPFPTNNKIDIEMYRTLKAESDQQRVRFKNSVYLKLEKSTCHWEAQKANLTDTKHNRSGYTMKMNVQQKKEEVGVRMINSMFPKHPKKKMQGSKDEPGVLMTQTCNSLPPLSPLKWNKEMQRLSYAGQVVYIEPISGNIIENVQNKKQHMSEKEETNGEKADTMRGLTHAADRSMKSKKSLSSYTLHRTELYMNLGSQGQKTHEGQGKSPGTVQRKVDVSKPPIDLKLDKGTQVEEEELGSKRPTPFPQMLSVLSDAENTEDTETIGGDVRKRKHLSQKEKDREQNRTKVDQDLLEIAGFSFSQLQLSESSAVENNKYANSNEEISSCNTTIGANQLMTHIDSKDRVKTEDAKGKKSPQRMTLRMQTSTLTQVLSKKRLPLNIKQKVEDAQEDKGKPHMLLRKASASLRSPCHLKWDTRMNEREDTLETIQPCFPPLKMQHLSDSGKKAYAKSLEGYMLKEDRLKSNIEDKMLPMYTDRKAKVLPLCTYSYDKRPTSKSTLEPKWQNKRIKQDNDILSKAGLPFLNSMGCSKDQNMLIAKRETQQRILVSESVSVSSHLMIPFQTEKLEKNMPPLKYILQRIGEIISSPKSGEERFDYLSADGIGCSTSSGGSPTRNWTGSLHSKGEKKDIEAQKVIKHTVNQYLPPIKSRNSVLGDPCDESSRRKVGSDIAKKYEDLQRDLLTRSTTSVLSESKWQKEVFKFPEGKNVSGPISVTTKAQKPPCSQTLTVTEHGTLYRRKEQECDSKSTIKDMQQNKSIDNALSSPTPFPTNNKIDIEMYRTLKAESDQQRVRFKNSVYLKLEKSTCYWEAQKANLTDTKHNRSGYTMKMNVQQKKEEVGVRMINSMFPKHPKKKMQGSKDEPGVLMTQTCNSLPPLSPLKWNKEMQRLSYAGQVVYIEPISGNIIENVQNKKQHMSEKEETNGEKADTMRGLTHAADRSMKSKKSLSSYTLHRTELYMNLGSQGQKTHEGQGKSPGTVQRKVDVSKPPIDLKLDKGTQVEEEELGSKRPTPFPQMLSVLSDAENTEDTETIGGDVRKRKHLSQKEKDREQNRTKVDQDLLEIAGFSFSQLQLSESSAAGNNKYANSNEEISSCNTIIEANQRVSYTDRMDRVKIEGKDRMLPQIMTLRIQTSPLTQLLSKKRLPLNIKQKVKDAQEDKGKPHMLLRKASVSLPSPFHQQWDTRMNEQEDTLGTIQPCFPPLNIKHSSYSGKKAHTKSFEGYKLKKNDRLKRDIETKVCQIYLDLKAKKSLSPHMLNIRELQCEITEQKRKVQEDKNLLVTNIKNICASLVTLPYLKFEATEGEGYMITIAKEPLPQLQSKESSGAAALACAEALDGDLSTDAEELKELMLQKEVKSREKIMDENSMVDPTDVYLNSKKSPISLIHNLSDLQRKTKEQEGKVLKVEPTEVLLTKPCTCSSPPIHLNINIRIGERSISPLTRSSACPVHFRESSESEEVVYVEPIIPDILISPQEGKQCVPQINLVFPIREEKKTQESKECDFNKPKEIALWNEDDSGVLFRSLSISGMNLPQTEEMIESETKLERKTRTCFPEFQEKSSTASEMAERDNSNTGKRGGQDFTSTVPEDSQPSMDQQQMQKLPSVKPEEKFSSEVSKINVTPQTEGGVVSGRDSARIMKEPNLLPIEHEEKASEPILTPTECPSMSEDPKESVEIHVKSTLSMHISPLRVEGHECRDQSEPLQDTPAQKVQQQNTFSGTVPTTPCQVESNKIKIVAGSTSNKESLLPLYDAIKNVFEARMKNMIQDKVCTGKLKGVKARYPEDCKSTPFSRRPDITPTTAQPTFQPKPILGSKTLEIKLNLIPKTAKQSFQKFDFYPKQTNSEDHSQRLYPRHTKMSFLSLEGIETIKLNLKHESQNNSPQISCMKTLTVVSSGSEKIITKVKSIGKLESGAPSVTSANKMPISPILQNYSEEEKDKLLIHFSMKTLEIQMKALPKIVTESYTVANVRDRKKPLSKCIHPDVKVPKQKNTISLGFEEKSLHQIEVDLQSKYLSFLLGLPVESMMPTPNTLPKHVLKLNTAATSKKVDNSGESGSLPIDTELLEQHISFKKQSPHENSSLIRRFLEPAHVCASGPEQHGTAQGDTVILSVLKPPLTPEKDKHHVWFQEAASLADCHSIQTFQYLTGRQTDIENSANLEECSALERCEDEEGMLLEASPYLSQESENTLYELQKSMPLENLYQMKQIQTDLKPLYSDNSVSRRVKGCRKPSSVVITPSYESHHIRKYRSSPKVQSPDWLCHSPLNTMEVPFASPTKLSEEELFWITQNSSAPLTESNLKLHLAKSQGKPHRHLERKKSNFDSYRNNIHWDCYPNYPQSKAKRKREKTVCGCEPERAGYFLSKRRSASKPRLEDFHFHYEGKQKQPFFYACVPADSLEIIPQTIRWTIPQKTLRKRNFRVPLVAKISSSFHMWRFHKKLGCHS